MLLMNLSFVTINFNFSSFFKKVKTIHPYVSTVRPRKLWKECRLCFPRNFNTRYPPNCVLKSRFKVVSTRGTGSPSSRSLGMAANHITSRNLKKKFYLEYFWISLKDDLLGKVHPVLYLFDQLDFHTFKSNNHR